MSRLAFAAVAMASIGPGPAHIEMPEVFEHFEEPERSCFVAYGPPAASRRARRAMSGRRQDVQCASLPEAGIERRRASPESPTARRRSRRHSTRLQARRPAGRRRQMKPTVENLE